MKKNNSTGNILAKKVPIKHLLRIMRTFFFLLFTFVFCSMAENSYTQNARVTINKQNTTLKEVFKEIEKQTDYLFIYNNEVNTNVKVSISIKQKVVSEVLNSLLKEKDMDYSMEGNHIILSVIKSVTEPEKETIVAVIQQNKKTITGNVLDDGGVPVIGANIIEVGTSNGTITDFDGKFALSVGENTTIQISYIGFLEQIINTTGLTNLNVVLHEDSKTLDDLVVVGYGTQKKVNLTGSITVVDENILKRNVTQSSQLLQGATPGITVTQSSGKPGSDQADITVRGLGTFSGVGNSPFVLVDGVPSSINSVSPNDIENITILKDAASAAIYGSRAANGVILITTKSGSNEKLQFNYDSYFGIQEPTQLPSYVDSWVYAEMLNEAYGNANRGPAYTQEDIDKFRSGNFPDEYPNVSHVRDIFNSSDGFQTRHNFSLNGKQGKTQFLFSFGYLKQNGIIKKVNYDRYDIRLNLNSQILNNLILRARISSNFSTQNEPGMLDEGNIGDLSTVMRYATTVPATIPGKKSDGTYGVHLGHAVASAAIDSESFGKYRSNFFMNNFSLEWKVIEKLKITAKAAYDWTYNRDDKYAAKYTWDVNETITPGPSKMQVNTSNSRNLLLDSYLDYETMLANGQNLHLLLGFSHNVNNYESLNAYRENNPSIYLHVIDAFATANRNNSGNASIAKLTSFFGRINYNIKDTYLLEGNIRYDGSSRFPAHTRFGFFPSFSAGWVISNEKFFDIPLINHLKIRTSYGKLGNQQIETYSYQKTLNLNVPYPLGETETLHTGIALTRMPFENITWEKISAFNQGADINLFNNHLSITVDHYIRTTTDILYNLTVSSVMGREVSNQNAGKVENRGWEFELNFRNSFGKFSYGVRPNFSLNHNKILYLAGVEEDITQGLFIGYPLGSIYGYKTDGLFIDQNDIDNYATQNYSASPGLIRYVDISGPDGVPDGIISAEYDRTVIGNTIPKYTFGLGIDANYKGFDFLTQIQGLAGFEKRLEGKRFAFHNSGNIEQWHVDNRWTPENPNRYAKYPKLIPLSSSPEIPFGPNSEYWLQDASFVRLKTVQLGYTIPKSLLNKTSIENMRVYICGENIITLDSYYVGWDPEMSTGGYEGSSYYPLNRVWLIGINLQF